MLTKFGARNFCSFKEWIVISFELDKNCPEHISNGKPISNVMCVKGANGSGKTNALKILTFLSDFCKNSFSYKPESQINLQTYFNNDDPAEFFVDFIFSGIEYRYELKASKNEVVSEKLHRKQNRMTKVLDRNREKLSCIKEFDDVKIVKLRSNASIISTANQYEISVISPVYSFFNYMLSNVNFLGLRDSDSMQSVDLISEYYHNHDDIFDFVKSYISKFDKDIKSIKIASHKNDKNEDVYFPIFEFEVSGELKYLTYYNQSSGTKSLYRQLAEYKLVLMTGGILILDEFDVFLHPHILPELLRCFMDDSINTNGAQIIFTTHNSEILDLMSKYRTILINKEENESYGYRLDEIPGDILRNDRSLLPVYKSGKIGGVPRL
ncbi:AAA family ATPase [Trichlorobacter lovleyi]|uniref:Abortive infection protein n=1 Tax=Trichlorobacter lovleyi (strain ATCC BAA-1151 / DSM 17278 / SZ) TaxID=398767 RepID=B3E8M1_TRIL1|nr:ATP-binding protein [Trichlorobacter lovleyi]ACD96697.1 abortive infection protein [Trichlorobacter lovleyi SZ]